MIIDEIGQTARAALKEMTGAEVPAISVEFPEDASFGDFTVNCFHLAKSLRKAPPILAAELAPRLVGRGSIIAATAVSGYVNVTVDRAALFRSAIPAAVLDATAAGRNSVCDGRRLLVEFSAPNTNKPQHLGHLRNNFLGDSVSRLLANAGANVTKVNLINDRGIHICKSMLAYQRFGNGVTPQTSGTKGDHLVGRFYVEFEKAFQKEVDEYVATHEAERDEYVRTHAVDRKGQPRPVEEVAKEWRSSFKEEGFGKIPLGAAAQEMLRQWERGDPATVNLWKTMNGWVFDGFNETYARLGIAFDRIYLESETYKLGRDLILDALERGIFQKRADGAVEIDLSAHGLGKKVVLRSDGTSVYITQDIGTTVQKAEQWNADGQTWVVADEQKHHFKVLFKILELMGYPWAKGCHHLAYGLVNLPEGRMKSREGTVVDADDLLDEVSALAKDEIKNRDPEVTTDELSARSEKIALAALRFMLLKVNPVSTMVYNPKESVSFDGDTGPYILYTFARIRRMLRDSGLDLKSAVGNFDPTLLGAPTEVALARALLRFNRATARAAAEFSPAVVCTYLHDLAQAYNAYYQEVPVLRATPDALKHSRLLISSATANVLERGCALLGIAMVDRM